MKRVLKNLIYLFGGVLLIIPNVNAATIAVGSDQAPASSSGKSVALEIKDDDLKDYTKLEFQLSISGTSYANMEFSYSASMTYNKNGEIITITNTNGLYATTLGSIAYKTTENLNSDFTITPTNVKFYKIDPATGEERAYTTADGIKVQAGTIKFEAPKSNDASLTSLAVSQGTLTPAFNKDVTSYEVTVSDKINTLKITGDTVPGASKTGTGNKTLEMGKNSFDVVVTAEDGTTTKTYTIVVNRGEEAKPSAYLKKLSINNIGIVLSPEFDKTVNKYTVDVTPDITKLDFKYEPEDKDATVEIEGNENFKEGKNKVVIKVTSSDSSETQEYKITVNVSEKEKKVEKKVEKKKKKLSIWIILAIIFGVIAIVGGVAFIIFKKKKNKNKPKNKDDNNGDEINNNTDTEIDANTDQNELFQLEKTTTFDSDLFKNVITDEDELEKTKEFHF